MIGWFIFLSFLIGWVGFILWSCRVKKWSLIISVGGGFIVGCISLIVMATLLFIVENSNFLSNERNINKSIVAPTVKTTIFEDLDKKLINNSIDTIHLNQLLGRHIDTWNTFTLAEKMTVAKGTIISMDMETFENSEIFHQHAQSAIACMDTNNHGINHYSSESKVQIGIIECAAKTYRQYCTICKP